jgi:CubicO group peptidase (beta-lactamase class C family)
MISVPLLIAMACYSLMKVERQSYNSNGQFMETLAKNICNRCQVYDIPGAAVGVIDQGNIVAMHTHGYADRKLQKLIQERSIFQLASISKTFSSWGIMKLVEQGKIDLDMSIKSLIRDLSIFSHIKTDEITPKMLLNHTSGLSPESYQGYPSFVKTPTLLESISGARRIQDRLSAAYPPGKAFLYSGGNYTLLQYIVENVTGSSFESFMQKEIFDPLQLSETSFDFMRIDKDKICTPYGIFGQALPTNLFAEHAAAGLFSTLLDVTKFIVATLEIIHSQQKNVLTTSSLSAMLQDNEYHYGLGYELEKFENDLQLVYHFGANSGWRGGFFILPAIKSGIVILTNSDNGRYLIEDVAGSWVKWKSGVFPAFYKETFLPRTIVKGSLIVLFILFALFTVRNEMNLLKRSKNILSFLFWPILLIGWVFIFCSSYIHPNGWVIGAFMPAGFMEITNIVLFFSGINIVLFLANLTLAKSGEKNEKVVGLVH